MERGKTEVLEERGIDKHRKLYEGEFAKNAKGTRSSAAESADGTARKHATPSRSAAAFGRSLRRATEVAGRPPDDSLCKVTMPSFEKLFRESKGQPVKFKQHVIQMFDCLPIASDQRLRVVIESVQSDWQQGIALQTDGEFEVENQPPVKKAVALWCKTPPREFLVRINSKKRQCVLKNVWDVGDGVMHSWHNGAAMIVEEIRNGRRYRCNDGRPDEDFDDLIFRVELLPPLSVISGKKTGE